MTEITLVRHGETDWNKNMIIQGRKDIPLNETGIEQAKMTAQHFKPGDFDLIFSTPLIRTKQTALIIADEIHFDEDVLVNEDFIERDFGDADGKLIQDYYPLVLEGRVPNLESDEAIQNRVMNGLKTLARLYPNRRILIVCHSHTIKAALTAIDSHNYDFTYKLHNCSITNLSYQAENTNFIIKRVNHNEFLNSMN
jgi:uncharacterized phosphatase